MASFEVSENARDDLYRIWIYGLENWGIERTNAYFHAFFDHFAELAKDPMRGTPVDGIRQGYRRSVCGKESVYYRWDEDAVQIMAVIGQQDPDIRV